MTDPFQFETLCSDVLAVIRKYNIGLDNFGVSITLSPSMFDKVFFLYPGLIQGRFIGRNVVVNNTQASIQIMRRMEVHSKAVIFPVREQDPIPFAALCRDTLTVIRTHGLDPDDFALSITLAAQVFDALFADHSDLMYGHSLYRNMTVDGTSASIQILRRMEVNPSMVMYPPNE
jgi:hypothetical protein